MLDRRMGHAQVERSKWGFGIASRRRRDRYQLQLLG